MRISSLIPMARGQANESFLRNLELDSPLLKNQGRVFPEIFAAREAQIFCFYETKTSPQAKQAKDGKWQMNGEHEILVQSSSATHCRPWENKAHHVLGLDRDHSGLVKFRPGDQDYIKVRNVLRKIVTDQYDLPRPKPVILQAEQDLTDKCLKAMGHTNPNDVMRRIEATKDDLVTECNEWIKRDASFGEWKKDPEQRLLWLRGDPGKGKTMLMMSIVHDLRPSGNENHELTFFFCENADPKLNTAHAVLCGLLWLLVHKNPILGRYFHKDCRHQREFLSDSDSDSFFALCRITSNLLENPALPTVYILIDAIDECDERRHELLTFIIQNASSTNSKAKWLISSRNEQMIEIGLKEHQHGVLSLELNDAHIAAAVEYFIYQKVDRLAELYTYNAKLRGRVLRHMMQNANSTFLWVALACKHLNNVPRIYVPAELAKLPSGLSSLYGRMLEQLRAGQDHKLTTAILKFVTIAKRPLLTEELLPLLAQEIQERFDGSFEDLLDNGELLDLIKTCGSFITVRDGVIYLIHQSVKDYLLHEETAKILSPHMSEEHCAVVDRSLAFLARFLNEDAGAYYSARQRLNSSLLLKSLSYICCSWVDHLADYQKICDDHHIEDLCRHEKQVYDFITKNFLGWTEIICLVGQLKAGPPSLGRLEAIAKVRYYNYDCLAFLVNVLMEL